jgi:threonine synthase
MGWFDVSTLKEPYRIEGKKTMGLELAEQLGWDVPDVILYPTGGGTGLIGMWKGFRSFGHWLLEGQCRAWWRCNRPRCGPLVKAFDEGKAVSRRPGSRSRRRCTACACRSPSRISSACRRCASGFGSAVDDGEAEAARAEVASADGVHLGPEARLLHRLPPGALRGRSARATASLFNCASGLKSEMPRSTAADRFAPIDFAAL